jgi:hypothetical protein
MITGNVVLYGAISGEAHFRGWRASDSQCAIPARAVVEGVGDHGLVHDWWYGRGTGCNRTNFAAGISAALPIL